MKKLFFLFAFLVGLGISSSVYAQLTKPITLDSPNTLASKLGADVGKVTILKVSGLLGIEDFKTMKERMGMLQVLDMSGVTALPMVGEHYYEEVTLPGIPANAFEDKRTLQQVVFPAVLQRIDDEAFKGCSNLTEADFSQAMQLKQIRDRAFLECSGLKELDLSVCVALEEILGSAFNQCSNL
ncbi:leucine-rich repeat domain-containing protein [Parabacteroides distasonis]|uniref:leucine-rich repeat domain-containing protein n=1 Tax=Parabacteroides distasonis TaxID=823 RepID=UPI001E45BBBA|nr:leucine-rich repeat domain-containing protein [Parabacteroides distasonis]